MDFVAFDLETTGTTPGADRIVEIGAVKFSEGAPNGSYCMLVDPQCPVPLEAEKVSGISTSMVEGKPLIGDVLKPFADFCGEMPLIAHNAKFDFSFLEKEYRWAEMSGPPGAIIDSCGLAREVVPGLPTYRLSALVRFFEIPPGRFHRAEDDAALCGMVFLHLIELMKKENRRTTVPDIISFSRKPEYRFIQFKRDDQLGLF